MWGSLLENRSGPTPRAKCGLRRRTADRIAANQGTRRSRVLGECCCVVHWGEGAPSRCDDLADVSRLTLEHLARASRGAGFRVPLGSLRLPDGLGVVAQECLGEPVGPGGPVGDEYDPLWADGVGTEVEQLVVQRAECQSVVLGVGSARLVPADVRRVEGDGHRPQTLRVVSVMGRDRSPLPLPEAGTVGTTGTLRSCSRESVPVFCPGFPRSDL